MANSTTQKTLARRPVLAVDDEPLLLAALEAMLVDAGLLVETAVNGEEALAKFEPGRFQLIITDLAMPRMDGLQLAKAVRRRSPAQLIMLATGSSEELKTDGRNCSAVDFVLQKPFTAEQLRDALAEILPHA
jgi:CheY-like chemotaxis protein